MEDVRLIRLARLLGIAREAVTSSTAAERTREGPQRLASALFAEALASDDVTSSRAALAFVEARLHELRPYVDGQTAEFVVQYAEDRISDWGSP